MIEKIGGLQVSPINSAPDPVIGPEAGDFRDVLHTYFEKAKERLVATSIPGVYTMNPAPEQTLNGLLSNQAFEL